jgi:hypothetical protein
MGMVVVDRNGVSSQLGFETTPRASGERRFVKCAY